MTKCYIIKGWKNASKKAKEIVDDKRKHAEIKKIGKGKYSVCNNIDITVGD